MKFKSYVGKMVSVGGRFLTFSNETYETDDQAEIAALKNAQDVSEVKAKVEKAEKQ